ncbi:hypothetical protein [Hyphomonas sp.]|jgi:hypothetical protein|uniref:hypothetical protein n=1 Tax=Hyphomonas sp. TaxID=87 RepID=UPI0025C3BA70|nr:hypothetical protein [Hyphomonas sp.]
MEVVEYRRRASLADTGEAVWRAYPDRLEQAGPGGTLVTTVPYRAVKRLRLGFTPGRFQTTRFLMELTGTKSRLVITNLHAGGIGALEDRSDTFFALVRAVVAGVHRTNPDAAFMAGEQPAIFWLLLAFNLAAFTMLALVVTHLPIVPGNISASVIIKAVVILFSLPLMMSWLVNARPRRFDPQAGLEKVIAARTA